MEASRPRSSLVLGFLLAVSHALPAPSEAGEQSPFVPGFDRFHRGSDELPQTGGELLLRELSCTACHKPETTTKASGARPAKGGPHLEGAGTRLHPEWIRHFLQNPQQAKPGTTMPDLLHSLVEEEKEAAVRALTAYLSSLKAPLPELNSTSANPVAVEFWRKGDLERGKRLYHQVGCVACHAPDETLEAPSPAGSRLDELLAQLEPEELEELGLGNLARPVNSVPLGDLPAKYTRHALTFFLLDPTSVRPGGRMPSLKLSPEEAADIVAYLLGDRPAGTGAPQAPNPDETLIETGRRLFHTLQCVNCHAVPDAEPPTMARPLEKLDFDSEQGCLQGEGETPKFLLNEAQRTALADALRNNDADEAADPLHLRMLQLNCYGCHEREGTGGVGPNRRSHFENIGQVDIGDEGRLPPPLDGVGRKLKKAWLKKVLTGTGDVRPYLQARMPTYPEPLAEEIMDHFVRADRTAGNGNLPESFEDAASLAEAGRKLIDAGCTQCHPVRGEHVSGVIGIDLADLSRRLEPDWYHEFLLNPIALKSRTRMPTFFPDGRSSNPQILEGEVDRQIAAMWIYLNDADQPLPEKLEQAKAHFFELVPDERPIVLRTFMEKAGTQAIAVGFPQGVHFSFDADHSRPVRFWRGQFLDAHGTWFDRFAPPAHPLGTDLISLPQGPSFALLESADAPWPVPKEAPLPVRFRGYRLDEQGIPTLLYSLGEIGIDIEERFEPAEFSGAPGMKRHIRILPRRGANLSEKELCFRAHSGHELLQREENQVTCDARLTVHLAGDILQPVRLRSNGEQADWIVPIESTSERNIEIRYQW